MKEVGTCRTRCPKKEEATRVRLLLGKDQRRGKNRGGEKFYWTMPPIPRRRGTGTYGDMME